MSHRDLPPLGALRAFEVVARRSSFRLAAEELGVTPTAISHQIRQLEAHLGRRILDRSPRAVTLRPEGRALLAAVSDGFGEIARVARALRVTPAPRGITLTATTAFLSQWLVPRLAALRVAAPDLELRLHGSDRIVALEAGDVDVAVRYGEGPFGPHARRLRRDAFAPVCSPRLGVGRPQDLAGVRLIHIEGQVAPQPLPTWHRWFEVAGVAPPPDGAGLRVTDGLHAVQAALAGEGIAIVSLVLVADALAAGSLIQPFATCLPGGAYHFVPAPGAEAWPNVLALGRWLEDALRETEQV